MTSTRTKIIAVVGALAAVAVGASPASAKPCGFDHSELNISHLKQTDSTCGLARAVAVALDAKYVATGRIVRSVRVAENRKAKYHRFNCSNFPTSHMFVRIIRCTDEKTDGFVSMWAENAPN